MIYDRSSGIPPQTSNLNCKLEQSYLLHELFTPPLRQHLYHGLVIRCICRLTEVCFRRKLWMVHREQRKRGLERKRRIVKIEYAPAIFKISSFEYQTPQVTMTLRVPDSTLIDIFGGITAYSLVHDVASRKECSSNIDRGLEQGCTSIVLGLQQSALDRDSFVMDIVLADFPNESCRSEECYYDSGTLLALGPYP